MNVFKNMKFLCLALIVFCLPTAVLAENFARVPAKSNFRFACSLDEDSESSVDLDSFEIAIFPVTNREYKAFLNENPDIRPPRYWKGGNFPEKKENHPVLDVSLIDAKKYCAWRSRADKTYDYRIPTEAEWEFAALGNTGNRFPWGNDFGAGLAHPNFNYNVVCARELLSKKPELTVEFIHPKSSKKGEKMKLSEVLVFSGNRLLGWINHKNHTGFVYTDLFKKINENGGATTPVDAFPRNRSPFGVRDMAGNSWDWTDSLIVAQNGAERGKTVNAIRGGSWYATARSCESTFRGEGRNASGRYNTVGFRIVRYAKKKQ